LLAVGSDSMGPATDLGLRQLLLSRYFCRALLMSAEGSADIGPELSPYAK